MSNLKTLNMALFRELERLEECETSEELEQECKRAKAVSGLANNIISNGALAVKAAQLGVGVGEQVETREFLLGDGSDG